MPRTDSFHLDNQAPATVFDQVNEMIARCGGEDLVRLDMGDTTLEPPRPARPFELERECWRDYNLYTPTAGIPQLQALLLKKLIDRNRLQLVSSAQIQICCGAIHALFTAFKTVTQPGEDVMVLAPRWPLITGVIEQAGARPVDLPFYTLPETSSPKGIEELLDAGLTEKTTAIYLNTPNNPSGRVLNPEEVRAIGRFAARNRLWVISDEAYEDFIYTDEKHLSPASLPEFASNTISVFTFSKCLAAAGYRVGYAVAEEGLIRSMNRISAQTIYNAPTDNQQLAAQALQKWDDWFPDIKAHYREARDLFSAHCKAEFKVPAGGFFAFIDMRAEVARRKKHGDTDSQVALDVLEDLIREGVALLPGEAFGKGYEGWLRACFIAEDKVRLLRGIECINKVLGA